ncbi:MAG: hypothetical protein IKR72_00040 [Bacteroidales bacterium]|nr:hypothetical protein [Bacteroidales bacterium]
MRYNHFILGLLSLLAASCSYSEITQPEEGFLNMSSNEVFYATIDEQPDADTKVYADDQLRVLWNEDDRITIFSKFTYNQEYRFLGEDGDNAGAFRKVPNDDYVTGNDLPKSYAIYPYLESTKISNDGMITFTLPSEQIYHPDSFGIGANTMVSASETNELRFKNVGGYLSLKFYGEGVSISSITLKGNNGELLAGKCSIDMSSGLPVLSLDDSKATDAITLVCDPAVDLGNSSSEAIAFWFVLPPVTFTKGITVTVNTKDGGVFEKSTSNKLEIGRSAITKLGALEVVPRYIGNIDFADENFKAYCVENFDKDGDGEVSLIEAEKVTHIEVLTNHISSLQGVEFFSNLISLSCSGAGGSYSPGNPSAFSANGRLETLDVSKNKSLEYLVCFCNNINQLDLSENRNLTYLNCGMNPMTCLGLGNNTSYLHLDFSCTFLDDLPNLSNFYDLEFLDCGNCNYRSIDVSHMFNLAYLNCRGNQLRNLDISNNTALEYLDCSYNYMGPNPLDLSKNTSLHNLRCDYNYLLSLDVSKNIYLEELSCDGNRLTSLDVSNNSLLTTLSCNSNRLTSLDVCNNPLLQWLFCEDNLLSSLYLETNVALRDLICSSNQITTLDVSNNTTLEQLYYENNPYLTEIWLKTGQSINDLAYDTDVATIKYKPDAIDLGLPSGLKWASFNLGASAPEEYGDYYAWGETEPYYNSQDALIWKEGKESGYSWASYKWCMKNPH